MFLLIDPSLKDTIHLALFDELVFKEANIPGANREMLAAIDDFFTLEKFDKKNLKGITVVVGVGNFTSTRLATTIANTFGYVLRIPLLAITSDKISECQKYIPDIIAQPIGQYISATYSAEANIGKKK